MGAGYTKRLVAVLPKQVKRGVAALALAGITINCGGESTNQAQAPSTPSKVTVTGRVTSNPSGQPIAGAEISIDGGPRVATDAGGAFSFERDASLPAMRVQIAAAGHITRETGIANTTHAVTIDLISLDAPFSMEFYQWLVRDGWDRRARTPAQYPRGTSLWSEDISVYLQTMLVDPAGTGRPVVTSAPVPLYALDLVAQSLPVIVSTLTGGRRRVLRIDSGAGEAHIRWANNLASPPPQIDPGWLIVDFFDRNQFPQNYSGFGGIELVDASGLRARDWTGLAAPKDLRSAARLRLGVHTSRFACAPISAGLVWHEAGHALGLFHIPSDVDRPNLMGSGSGCDGVDYSPLEKYHSRILYSRPYGNQDPDRDPTWFSF